MVPFPPSFLLPPIKWRQIRLEINITYKSMKKLYTRNVRYVNNYNCSLALNTLHRWRFLCSKIEPPKYRKWLLWRLRYTTSIPVLIKGGHLKYYSSGACKYWPSINLVFICISVPNRSVALLFHETHFKRLINKVWRVRGFIARNQVKHSQMRVSRFLLYSAKLPVLYRL